MGHTGEKSMEKCIPVTISTKHNLPWVSSTIKPKVRKRKETVCRAMKTGCPTEWNKYTTSGIRL